MKKKQNKKIDEFSGKNYDQSRKSSKYIQWEKKEIDKKK